MTDFQIRCPAAGAPPCLLGSLPHLHTEHVDLLAWVGLGWLPSGEAPLALPWMWPQFILLCLQVAGK